MDLIPIIPPFLAVLNATAATLLIVGYTFVRHKNRSAHRACMISALVVSTVFMVFYLYYHAKIGNIPFAGTGIVRPVYFSILATHVILAAFLFPMALGYGGIRDQGKDLPAPADSEVDAADMAVCLRNGGCHLLHGVSHVPQHVAKRPHGAAPYGTGLLYIGCDQDRVSGGGETNGSVTLEQH